VVKATVNGIHAASISQVRLPSALHASDHDADPARAAQYFILTALPLYHALREQIVIGQVERRWTIADEVGGGRMLTQELRGKTVGVLGYGYVRVRLCSDRVQR
jgi:phosphoglycerate dehydrogenase-like enzyme